jgi:hypothetical protein
MRANAVRRRQEGIPLRERLLGDPDGLARLARPTAALANLANTQQFTAVGWSLLGASVAALAVLVVGFRLG